MSRFVSAAVILSMAALFVAGCAGSAKGPTDEELITQRIQEGMAAIKAKNLAAFEGMVDASFSSSAVGDKAGLIAYLENADSMGYLDNLEVDLSEAKTVVTGDKATVGPVVANGSFGTQALDFEGIKRNGTWVIIGLEPAY